MTRLMVCVVAVIASVGALGCDGSPGALDAGALAPDGPAEGDAGFVPTGWPDAGHDASVWRPQLDAGTRPPPPPRDAGHDAGATCFYFYDEDGDGYGSDALPPLTLRCDSPIPADYVELDGDCLDTNRDVHPGQTRMFPTDRGDGSIDYNCDGLETMALTDWGICNRPDVDPPGEGQQGWRRICLESRPDRMGGAICDRWAELPACGDWERFVTLTSTCTSTGLVVQRCG